MYLMPYDFSTSSFFSDEFKMPFDPVIDRLEQQLVSKNSYMKTDIKEKDGNYEFVIDLPGFKKEDVNAEIDKEGYLNVTVKSDKETEVTDEKNNYIRKERYNGQISRKFYVGKNLKQEDVKAKFENGTLIVTLPKATEEIPENAISINIEG